MNYYEMRSMFLDILNRTDVTPEDADKLIYLGVTRIERRLRSMLMKVEETLTARPDGGFTPPDDMLTIERIEDADGVVPRVGSIRKGVRGYRLTPSGITLACPQDTLKLTYYASFDKTAYPEDSTATPKHAAAIPDVIVYGSLVYAADKYEDARAQRFENSFERLLAEVQLMADEVELSGHPVINNPYEGYI